jgi:hypothetical protein
MDIIADRKFRNKLAAAKSRANKKKTFEEMHKMIEVLQKQNKFLEEENLHLKMTLKNGNNLMTDLFPSTKVTESNTQIFMPFSSHGNSCLDGELDAMFGFDVDDLTPDHVF